MIRPAIVVIAYNRPDALKRLLDSINRADYPKDTDIPLIVSIDYKKDEKNRDTKAVAEEFNWKHGSKKVKYHHVNMGLKKHVLSCGDYSQEYDGVIMLEDDLFVSKSFYHFACAALTHTAEDEKIGGISLYNHLMNVHVREPFEAIDDGYDNWYFQFASSWGQAFTSRQWRCFKEWMSENDGKDLVSNNMPENVSGWSDKSWLKYYIAYLIEKDMYFLYPRRSLTTNFSEEGEHATEVVCDLQVPLMGRVDENYHWNFSTLEQSRAKYDAFFENITLCSYMTDLYGYKKIPEDLSARFLLSSKLLPYAVMSSYGRLLRPIDANIVENIPGNDFFMYDLTRAGEKPKAEEALKSLYNYKALKVGVFPKLFKYRISGKLRSEAGRIRTLLKPNKKD